MHKIIRFVMAIVSCLCAEVVFFFSSTVWPKNCFEYLSLPAEYLDRSYVENNLLQVSNLVETCQDQVIVYSSPGYFSYLGNEYMIYGAGCFINTRKIFICHFSPDCRYPKTLLIEDIIDGKTYTAFHIHDGIINIKTLDVIEGKPVVIDSDYKIDPSFTLLRQTVRK